MVNQYHEMIYYFGGSVCADFIGNHHLENYFYSIFGNPQNCFPFKPICKNLEIHKNWPLLIYQ